MAHGPRILCVVAVWLSAFYLGTEMLPAQDRSGDTNPMANNPDAVPTGRRLYDQTCQACHGGGGRGDRGPALTTRTLPHGSDDGDIFRNIRNGIPGSGMPAFSILTADQIWQLVSYIRSLSSTAAAPNETVVGDPAAGETLFFGKAACSTCHQVNGRGGIVGPDLSAARRTAAQTLRLKIVEPNTNPELNGRGGGPGAVGVKTDDGREIRGSRRAEDTYSLQVLDTSGKLLFLDKAHVTDERYEFKSLMPDDYSTRLTGAEIQNVVAYLKTLDGRNFAK